MNAAQSDQTFQDGICRRCVLQAIHGRPESNEIRPVVWMLEPAPDVFFGIVRSVKSGLVRLVGMSKLRVKKNLRKVTGALERFVHAIEMHQNRNTVRASSKQHILDFHYRCHPEGSYVLRFGPSKSSAFCYLVDHPKANLANSSSTDFPVSNADDRRLLANTSGDTSLNI